MDLLFFLGLALALGFKHSYDADHLVAVSNLLVRSRDLRRTALMSVSWAAGHMLTASGITVILFVFREILLRPFLDQFEVLVGLMLISIGAIYLLWEFRVLHRLGLLHDHAHEHPAGEHEHPHFHLRRFGDHGTIFSLGVVLGMVLFGVGISYPMLRWGDAKVRRIIGVIASVLSIAYGILLLLGFQGVNLIGG